MHGDGVRVHAEEVEDPCAGRHRVGGQVAQCHDEHLLLRVVREEELELLGVAAGGDVGVVGILEVGKRFLDRARLQSFQILQGSRVRRIECRAIHQARPCSSSLV